MGNSGPRATWQRCDRSGGRGYRGTSLIRNTLPNHSPSLLGKRLPPCQATPLCKDTRSNTRGLVCRLVHLLGVEALGFGVWGLGFGVWGLGFEV